MGNWGDFCTYCGTALSGPFPRKCSNNHSTYSSAVQVGVALQPVRMNARLGVLVVQRNINPYIGEYALPGGFVDPNEIPRQAAVRELTEETSIQHKADDAKHFSEAIGGSHRDNDPRAHVMHFYEMPELTENAIDMTFHNEEVQSLKLLFLSNDMLRMEDKNGDPCMLCFNSHHSAALAYLQKRGI